MSFASGLLVVSIIIVILGALNMGWIGLTSNNLISTINNATFRNDTLERIVYIIVGLAALYMIFNIGFLTKIN